MDWSFVLPGQVVDGFGDEWRERASRCTIICACKFKDAFTNHSVRQDNRLGLPLKIEQCQPRFSSAVQ